MKIIRNKIIPFKGFKAINVCGILFVREDAYIDEKTMNHESIHTAQMKELLFVFFYVLYIVEWIIRLLIQGNAYRNISFEKEAYRYQDNKEYLKGRKRYAWIKVIFV